MGTRPPPDGTPGLQSSAEGFQLNGRKIEIRDVWADNLEAEMDVIRGLVERYKYIAMDTEFPGIVIRPLGTFTSGPEYHYQTLRMNVNMLKLIQLGLTFADENGELAEGCPTWQFNFRFNLEEDMFAEDSIELLTRSGIDFRGHQERGIDIHSFAELLMSSGLVLCDDVRWLSFHSGYDFGYLLKLLTASALPEAETGFYQLLHTYFPHLYDIKQLMLVSDDLRGGLQKLAEDLDVQRVGPMHQAGSDSLLTSSVFFKLRSAYFRGKIEDSRWKGILFGLSNGLGS